MILWLAQEQFLINAEGVGEMELVATIRDVSGIHMEKLLRPFAKVTRRQTGTYKS